MDDFNMNNKTPLNSSDQNNEQPAAETRNTAPQNEQPAQAPQSEQPMQQPQAEQPAQAPQNEQPMQQPQAEQPAQAPQSEQPQAEEPRTPFQTPVQHPEFRQAQQQTGFGEVPPMSQKPHTPKNKKHSRGLALGLCGVAAACLLFAGGAVVGNMAFGGNANSDSGTSASTSDSAPTLQINSKPESDSSNSSDNYDTADGMAGEDIYKKVNPSVVSVISTTSEGTGSGSGVIMSKDGYIITNNHVVDGATKLRVKLNDGRTFDAKLIGKDSATDVALLKIDGDDDLPTLPFGSSDALRLGEWVLAIGSPFDLQSTITAGIVSAKARNLGAIPNDFRIESFIQTDAAVNPGNSGGALVNTRGELVGINTLIKSQTGSYIGYSFAIPEAIVRKVVVDLKEYGVVQRAMLGIMFRPVDQDFLDSEGKELGIKELGGIYVASVVEGGSASEAGIRKGDIILSIDGVKVNDSATVQELIARRRPNDKVKISVKRDGDVKQIDVTLRNKAGKTELITKEDVDVVEALGGKFADAGTKLCRELDIRGGVQVVGVKSDGILARARVKQGFVITHINDRPVYAVSDLERMTEKVRSIDGIYPNGRSVSYMLVE